MIVPEPRPQPVSRRPVALRRPLPSSPSSPMLARDILREALRRFPEETVNAAQLMVTELVTNVLLHARTALLLEVQVASPTIRVTVEDTSAALPQPASRLAP